MKAPSKPPRGEAFYSSGFGIGVGIGYYPMDSLPLGGVGEGPIFDLEIILFR